MSVFPRLLIESLSTLAGFYINIKKINDSIDLSEISRRRKIIEVKSKRKDSNVRYIISMGLSSGIHDIIF